ncbi:two-component system sensor histidine kinase NtrB [Sphingomonas flavalba]|uniref:two-component system sensor histidine kinase NtrB n=1 Tax=Sphingomonas flavalba TaxID=2559804 RepID=UPI00109DD4CD|nr:ATP-binding protein [Sphingomonas flavalba]
MVVARRRLTARPGLPAPGELLNALPAALIVIDPDGLVRDANAAAENLLNHSRAALCGRMLADTLVLPLDYLERGEPGAAIALYDVPLMTVRGQRFRADFIVTTLPDRPGWTLLTLHHGGAGHSMGHRLERSGGIRTAIGAAGMLAHEIKNPLSGIRGAAQLLEQDVPADAQGLTRLIQAEVDRIAALIDQMEGFTDTRPLPVAAENIYPILDHVRQLAARGFAAGVAVHERYDPSLPPAMLNRAAMIQILINLIKNAAEAAGKNGLITLTTAYRHGVSVSIGHSPGRLPLPIELCVIDDGPGAPVELAEHMFDPFVSGRPEGRGLGLALVDKLVRDMGGLVQYAREGTPERTVFRLLLPRAAEG